MSRVDELKQRLADLKKPSEWSHVKHPQEGLSGLFDSTIGGPTELDPELDEDMMNKYNTKLDKIISDEEKALKENTVAESSVFDDEPAANWDEPVSNQKEDYETDEEAQLRVDKQYDEKGIRRINKSGHSQDRQKTISKENAIKYSNLKQRLAAVNSLNESQRFQRQSTDARTQGKQIKNKHKRKIGDITKREDYGFIRTPSGIETQKIPRGLSGGSKNNAVRQRRRQ